MIPTQPIGITRPERLRLGPPRRVAELVLSWLRSHRPEAADPWRGRVLPARAPWHADRVAGGVRADRQPVPRWHAALAADNHIPVVRFRREDRKAEVMRPYLDRAARTGRLQVAAIGVAQEFARCGPPAGTTPTRPNRRSSLTKQQRRVTVFYEYVWDDDFGPAFLKLCAWLPYPIKVSRQRPRVGQAAGGQGGDRAHRTVQRVRRLPGPAALQTICDRLGPGTIRGFFQRWTSRLPLPLSAADRNGGYRWDLTMRQVETSRTIVLDAPATPAPSSTPWWPTTSTSAAPSTSSSSSGATAAARPPAPSRPRSTGTPRASPSTCSTDTPGSSSTSRTAVPAHRNRQQRRRRPRLPTPAAQPRRPPGQGPCDQPATAGHSSGSARARSLRVQPSRGSRSPPSPTMAAGPQPGGSATLGSGPDRHPGQPAVRRHRHHQQAPARLDDRTLGTLQPEPDQLRPCPAAPQRPDHQDPRPQPGHPDPDGIGFAVFSTKVHDRVLRPLLATRSQPTRHPNSAPRSTPSTTQSTNAWPHPAAHRSLTGTLQTHDNHRNPRTKESLGCTRTWRTVRPTTSGSRSPCRSSRRSRRRAQVLSRRAQTPRRALASAGTWLRRHDATTASGCVGNIAKDPVVAAPVVSDRAAPGHKPGDVIGEQAAQDRGRRRLHRRRCDW
jgi:hypothetical protein